MLKRNVYKHNPKNIEELKQFIVDEWEKLSPDYFENLCKSMVKRLNELKENEFKHTKY